MWIFAYGSLMWDGWEASRGCLRRVVAELPGFHRAFNKASVSNWGTNEKPCPTLILAADPSAICKGIAFEFPEEKHRDVLVYLQKREGRGFELEVHEIRLAGGDQTDAFVPVYPGKNLLKHKSIRELVAMAHAAAGKRRCIDYVQSVAQKLGELGVEDPAVDEFWRTLQQQPSPRRHL